MPDLKTYDLFISHAWKYGDDYDRLVSLLDNAKNFYYRNYSAPKDKPLDLPDSPRDLSKEIAEKLKNKIKAVNCVLVISGMYYSYKEWMQFEIDTAIEYNKPIIAIVPRGNTLVPVELQEMSKTQVGWNTDSIVSAIRKYSI